MYFCNFRVGKDFPSMSLKAETLKEKCDRLTLLLLNLSVTPVNKIKRQMIN